MKGFASLLPSKATANPTRGALVAPRKARNLLFGAFLLLAFLLRLQHQKKSGKRLKISLLRKGNPPLVRFFTSLRRSTPTSGPPSAKPRLGIHPSVALWKDKGVSRLRARPPIAACYFGHLCPRREFSSKTSPSAKPLKRLERNFQIGFALKPCAKSQFINWNQVKLP